MTSMATGKTKKCPGCKNEISDYCTLCELCAERWLKN